MSMSMSSADALSWFLLVHDQVMKALEQPQKFGFAWLFCLPLLVILMKRLQRG